MFSRLGDIISELGDYPLGDVECIGRYHELCWVYQDSCEDVTSLNGGGGGGGQLKFFQCTDF